MKTFDIKIGCAVCALLLHSPVWADAPPGVGSADVSTTPCYGQIIVSQPGTFTPLPALIGTELEGMYGVLIVELDGSGHLVRTNSSRGNLHLSCHGQIDQGEPILGFDPLTNFPIGGFAGGTASTNAEACEALTAVGLGDYCRGSGKKAAIILGPEIEGNQCNVEGVLTDDWKAVGTSSGKVMVSCHAYE